MGRLRDDEAGIAEALVAPLKARAASGGRGYAVPMRRALPSPHGIDSIASTDNDGIPKATQYVSQALAEIKAGKAVGVPTPEPYGCAVKYGS